MASMSRLNEIAAFFIEHLQQQQLGNSPESLYGPAQYILTLGGKRIRPALTLMGYSLYKDDLKEALPMAMAVEIFHNFTLVHDDIMDKADVRRGKPTVHAKYGENTAILAGDVLMIKAYEFITGYADSHLVVQLLGYFNRMATEVCEGQQMDMDFELKDDVSIESYIRMIELKTSVLLGEALRCGAAVARAPQSDLDHLYAFGVNFGIAFQIMDDILDTFGDPQLVGKKIGGDIIQNKKTFLFLKAFDLASDDEKTLLRNIYSGVSGLHDDQKVHQVTGIFRRLNVQEYANQVIEAYRDLAVSHVRACSINTEKQNAMVELLDELISRKY
jgi:geranylgeranyl diphosphate synthase type II